MQAFLRRFLTSLDPASFGNRIPVEVAPASAVYWWDDDSPLEEYPFLLPDGSESGYAIVSRNRQLPPMLEFALEGSTPSRFLTRRLAAWCAEQSTYYRDLTWYYFSPFELVASVSLIGTPQPVHLLTPSLLRVTLPNPCPIRRNPARFWSTDYVQRAWSVVDSNPTGPLSIPKILHQLQPVPYMQNCRAQALGDCKGTPTVCSPQCVSGCVPVAWAMLASSRRRSAVGGGSRKIWPGVSCWNIPWDSTISPTTNPSKCSAVDETIWRLNDHLQTRCDGISASNQIGHGANFLNALWGLGWRWQGEPNPSFQRCVELLHEDQSFLYSAHGEWIQTLADQFPDVPELTRLMGADGHATVVWGEVLSSYTGQELLLACMGWGKDAGGSQYPGSKWIDSAAFSRVNIYFVAQFD